MRFLLLVFLTLLFVSVAVRGQEPDSVRIYRQGPVLVTAGRSNQAARLRFAATTVLDAEALRPLDGLSLESALARLGGLAVRDLGSGSGVKTVSLRGIQAAGTVVLLNGARVNNPQNGLVDLGLYPIELFERVEILRGGQTAEFGPDATGGVINLASESDAVADRWSGRVTAGSFGLRGGTVRWQRGRADATVRLIAGMDEANNRYPIVGGSVPNAVREGAAFYRKFGSVVVETNPDGIGHVDVTLLGATADRGSPGPVGSSSTEARLRDDVGHLVARWVLPVGASIAGEAGLSGSWQWEQFVDPIAVPATDDRYRTTSTGLWTRWSGTIPGGWLWGSSLEAGIATADASSFVRPIDRRTIGVVANVSWTDASTGITVSPVVRFDRSTDVVSNVSGRLAIGLPLDEAGSIRMRSSVGTGHRVPNFNELYWSPGGNPGLRPESSVSADLGVDAAGTWNGEHRLSCGVFINATRDRIVGWPPVNILHTQTVGVETDWSWKIGDRIGLDLHATALSAVDLDASEPGLQLPFLPRETVSLTGRCEFERVLFAATLEGMSRRYTTTENLAALSADPFAVLHCFAATPLLSTPFAVVLSGGVDNVLNSASSIVPGFPLPGRSFRLSFTAGTAASSKDQ